MMTTNNKNGKMSEASSLVYLLLAMALTRQNCCGGGGSENNFGLARHSFSFPLKICFLNLWAEPPQYITQQPNVCESHLMECKSMLFVTNCLPYFGAF